MITAVDTNVMIALWDRAPVLSVASQEALDSALAQGGLVICAPVFAELLAAPGSTEAFLNTFLKKQESALTVTWMKKSGG